MTLAVVGSTKLGESALASALIKYVLAKYHPERVVSGGAAGIDTLAAGLARSQNIEVLEHLPKTRRWHDGFRPRNIKIAEDCDALVRIALFGGKTYGSGWTRDYAAKLGKPTEEFICGPGVFADDRRPPS